MCGIFGIINNKVKNFDYKTFSVLGVANDSRGGDSCGVFIDGNYEYGVDENKLFLNFFRKSQVLQSTTKAKIALGHCRKASIGAINIETAQPVVIKENDEVKFVVIHNGTIHNYSNLARKYIPQVNIFGMTDSQVMAHIFYYSGYDVLKEYNGAGVFVIVDYRLEEPEVYVFRGSSLETSISKTPTAERPFFFVEQNKSVIFSSIAPYLYALSKNEVFTVKSNCLLKLRENMEFEIIEEYDRSEMHQSKDYSYYNNSYYDRYYDDYYDSYYKKKALPATGNVIKLPFKRESGDVIITKASTFHNPKNNEKIFIKSNDDGTYSCKETLLHGLYIINKDGQILPITERNNQGSFSFWFWQGVLLFNKECYKFLKKVCKKMKMTEGQLMEEDPLLIHSFSPDPFKDDQSFDVAAYYISDSADAYRIFSNECWQYLLSENSYYFDADGKISSMWSSDEIGIKATVDDYMLMCKRTDIDFSKLIDDYEIY